MSWDAGLVGEIRIEPAKFAELEKGVCDAKEVAGLRALTTEPTASGSFAAIVKALDADKGERLLQIDRKPRKGTFGFLAVLDEDAFRSRLPALSQLFSRAASLGGEGELTLFGLESDDDLAHELVIANGRALIRPLANKGKLDKLREKVGMKLAMRMPPLVESVAPDAKAAVHPDWATRPMFPAIEVAYRRDAKKTNLVVDVRCERAHDGGPVLTALHAFEWNVNAGLFGVDGHAKVIERPGGARKDKRARGVIEVRDVDPLGLRVLVEDLAMQLTNSMESVKPGMVSLSLSNTNTPDIDSATMRSWLDDPTAFPGGVDTLPIPVGEIASPAKGSVVVLDTDLAPSDEKLYGPFLAVDSVLHTSPDPHGATRKALNPPIFAVAHGRTRKGKKGSVELVYTEFSADRTLARRMILAAVARMNAKAQVVRRVSIGLPG